MNLGTPCGPNRNQASCALSGALSGAPPRFAADIYKRISCADATGLSQQVQDWSFEFTQLSAGAFSANGGMAPLDSALVAQATLDQTLLHRGCAPRGSAAVLIPGRGSGQAFVRGRQLQSAQCIAMADGACIEAITQGRYVDVALAIDLNAWNAQSHWLNECPLTTIRGTSIESPGPQWITRMLNTVEWIFTAIGKHPEALERLDVRASLSDQFLTALADFGSVTDGAERHTRDARAQQRIAVERAREYIRARLAEPLRLSELCSYAHVQARALEYGFREITGLSPIAYVKSLRLNAVRKTLLRSPAPKRSISEIALDHGFWHLSQFAVDYRKFFGETPTSTRRRALGMTAAN